MSIPVLDAVQAAEWDQRARSQAGIPSRVLMETAGRAVSYVTVRELPVALRDGVVLVAGHGNNGGDGWVAARALRAVGVRVWATEVRRDRSPDCEANRGLALAEGVELLDPGKPWPAAGVVIDALLGTGASGVPRGPLGELAARVAEHNGPVVAVDGPTGLDLSTGEAFGPCRATLSVTFGAVRRGHLLARDWCGKVVVVDIGFPPPDPAWPQLFEQRAAAAALPPFEPAMHKGTRGRVLVIGGDEGMAGAALHAAAAALAAGAGLVKVAASEPTVQAAQTALPDALTLVTGLGPELEPALEEAIAWADALVIGPGLGRGADRTRFVSAILARARSPAALDADALHVGLDALTTGDAPRVLTPHVGEFRAAFPDLADQLQKDRFEAAARAALAATAAVLLKGVPTIITAPDRTTLVTASGNPALATGGSGDLLAGFIGCWLARGLAPQAAAALGAYTLGRGAELAASESTVRSTRPADVLAVLPEFWRMLAKPQPIQPPILLELHPPALV